MFRVQISLPKYNDVFYAADADHIIFVLQANNGAKILEVGYAYKRLDMYWEVDPCWLTIDGEYKTFKQLSRNFLDK